MRWRSIGIRSAPRQAYTLLELIVVISLLASLLAGMLSLVSAVSTSSRQADKNFRAQQEILRFAGDLRRDFKRSDRMEVDADDKKLTCGDNTQTVQYKLVSPSTIDRIVLDKRSVPLAKDRFVVGVDAEVTLQSLDNGRTAQWSIAGRWMTDNPILIAASLRTQSTATSLSQDQNHAE